jgi:hypothetical protein
MLAYITGTADQETTEERISGRREPDPESPNQRQVVVQGLPFEAVADLSQRRFFGIGYLLAMNFRYQAKPQEPVASTTST